MALTGIQIFKMTPKKNCKECGCPTCMAFAMKVAQGALEISKCPHMSDEALAELSEATAPPMKTIKVGTGEGEYTLGGETVLFRHEKTFVSKTRYAVAICTDMDDAAVDAKIAELQKKLSGDPENADLYHAQIAALEKELTSKISETNLSYQKLILEIDRQLRQLSDKSATALLAELMELQNKRDIVEAAINSSDYSDKLAALDAGNRQNADDAHAELEAKLAELEKQLEALKAVGELSIDDIIAKIQAGDAANTAEIENLKVVLKLYCDSLKDALGDRIAILEETISALQTALQERMQTLENRLTYSMMTDEELAKLEEEKQAAVNSLANQIAGVQLAVEQARKEGKDTSALEEQLSALTSEYYAAQNDLENIRYVMELRSTSELALHRKWIKELQELVAALQNTVAKQGETIAQQGEAINGLKETVANLEKALRDELANLRDELKEYVDGNVGELNAEIADLLGQVETLRDNVVTLATSSYSGYHSSTTGNGYQYNYSGTNKDEIKDDRDLRTSDTTALDF